MKLTNEQGAVNSFPQNSSSPTLDGKPKKTPTYLDRASRHFIPLTQYREICKGENPGAVLLAIVGGYIGAYSGSRYGGDESTFTSDRQRVCRLAFDRFPSEVSLVELMACGRGQYQARVTEVNHDLRIFGLQFVLSRTSTGKDGRTHTWRKIAHIDEPVPEPRKKETSGHVRESKPLETSRPLETFRPLPQLPQKTRDEVMRDFYANLGAPMPVSLPERGETLSLFSQTERGR